MDHIVLDIGGTNIRAAIYNQKLTSISKRLTISSPGLNCQSLKTIEIQADLIQKINYLIFTIKSQLKVLKRISIAFPGPVDSSGNVIAAPTIWGNSQRIFPLKKILSSLWPHIDILILNDLSAAGYRYVKRGYKNFCIITISSGIGQKIFYNGAPLIGSNYYGGEIGHLRFDLSDRALACECGGVGHLSAISSGRGTVKLLKKLAFEDDNLYKSSLLAYYTNCNIEQITTHLIAECFKAKDTWTLQALEFASRFIAQAIGMVHLAVGIDKFFLTGGFIRALGENYRQMIIVNLAKYCWNVGQDWQTIIQLGIDDDNDGLIGIGIAADIY